MALLLVVGISIFFSLQHQPLIDKRDKLASRSVKMAVSIKAASHVTHNNTKGLWTVTNRDQRCVCDMSVCVLCVCTACGTAQRTLIIHALPKRTNYVSICPMLQCIIIIGNLFNILDVRQRWRWDHRVAGWVRCDGIYEPCALSYAAEMLRIDNVWVICMWGESAALFDVVGR